MRSVALSSPKPGDARGFKLCPRSTIRAVMYIRGKVVKGSGLLFIIDCGDANVPTPTSPVPNIQGIHNWANWISWWGGCLTTPSLSGSADHESVRVCNKIIIYFQ